MGNRFVLMAVLAAWAFFAACALWLTRSGLALDTDSAMRLVQVRDLLAGQSWFDLTQHRLNTPYGLAMHWSRLVDAPLALLMLVSERFALTAWPLLLFAGLLFLLARLAALLGGQVAAAAVLVLTLLSPELYAIFTPGNIDHHGVQLVLMLAGLLGVVEKRPVLAAGVVALSLAVGLETLPYAGIVILFSVTGEGARRFGISLAGMALVTLALAAGPNRAAALCDSYSLFHAALLVMGGLGVGAITFLPRHRLAALGLLAVALAGLAALLNPVCLAGPYAGLDPRLADLFFARINEARPVWDFFKLSPSQTIGGFGYAAVALVLTFFAPAGRARNIMVTFALAGLAVASLQYRATPFALVFGLPGLAAGLVQLTQRRSLVWLAVVLVIASGAAFTLAGALAEGQDRVAERVTAFHAQEACGEEGAMALLRTLPPGRVAAFVDQGPAVLAYTPHSAVAGPYHRNGPGILDTYEIFAGKNPQSFLARRGIDYVMTCRAAPDWDFYRRRDGLVAQLAHGVIPDWLAPAGGSGAVQVYRVKR